MPLDHLTTRSHEKPHTEEPVVWSNEVQDIQHIAGQSALRSLEEMLPDRSTEIYDLLRGDLRVKNEFYGLFCHFADRLLPHDLPDGSRKGISVDREEAKLRVWLNLFEFGSLPWN